MPIPKKYLADFYENNIYHIYNRTNNKELLFLTDENRIFFLKQYEKYLSAYANTFCWCLLPNHFHILIRIKPLQDILSAISNIEMPGTFDKKLILQECSLSETVQQAFKRFFQSYALAFNKMHNRSGNLFYRPFKRVLVNKDRQFTRTIVYIHTNAMKHGLIKDFRQWQWSSWNNILSDKPTSLLRNELIEWFGSKEALLKCHDDMSKYYLGDVSAIDEE